MNFQIDKKDTLEKFREFVKRCDEEGIGVILDWVPGHLQKD